MNRFLPSFTETENFLADNLNECTSTSPVRGMIKTEQVEVRCHAKNNDIFTRKLLFQIWEKANESFESHNSEMRAVRP